MAQNKSTNAVGKNNKVKEVLNESDIVIPGYGEKNATIVTISRVSYKYNTIRVTIKQDIADLACLKAGDKLQEYYDKDKKIIVLRKLAA